MKSTTTSKHVKTDESAGTRLVKKGKVTQIKKENTTRGSKPEVSGERRYQNGVKQYRQNSKFQNDDEIQPESKGRMHEDIPVT